MSTMSWWIPQQRTSEWPLLPGIVVESNERATALMTAARESVARGSRAGRIRAARWLRQLAGASARITRTLERAARRLERAELDAANAPLLPDEWLLEAEESPAMMVRAAPPPIPAAALRLPPKAAGRTSFEESPYPLVTGPLMGLISGSLAPRA
jgi:hypothetical protein